MVTIKLMLSCVIVLCGVVIQPQINELKAEDFDKIKGHKDFAQLKKDGNIVVLDQTGTEVHSLEVLDGDNARHVIKLRAPLMLPAP